VRLKLHKPKKRRENAHSGDRERPIRSIVNTGSGDHERPVSLA
jgi:hypothetical protein